MSKKSRKRKLGPEDKAVFEWEKDRILPENLRDEMETMWEIPQIYHFLQLTKEAFNISHLSMYEVERMLLMPRASKQLAHIMTCLLSSSSSTKAKLQKIPPMPYEFWTNILTYKLRSWFKIYQTKHQDPVKVFDTLGVEPEFWKIFPDAAEIEGMDFQDFSFRQRVWLLKTVCDTAMHSRKTIQDEMAKQPGESQFETVLGIDRHGARYIYFPQFLHNDLRVYKHCLDNKILSTVKPPAEEVKPKLDARTREEPKAPRVMSRKKRRRSRWSNGYATLPQKKRDKRKAELPSIDQSILDSNSNSVDGHFGRMSRSSSKASEMSRASSFAKSSGYETSISADAVDQESTTTTMNDAGEVKEVLAAPETEERASEPMENCEARIEEDVDSGETKTEETMAVDDLDKSAKTSQTEDLLNKESSFLTVDDLSKSSKTDDEKLEEISSMNASKTTEKSEDSSAQLCSGSTKDVNISKSDDEKLSEHIKCDTSADSELLNDEMSLDKWMQAKKRDENANESFDNSDNEDVSDSTLSASGTRRSARIKHISEIKLEVEDVENMLEVCESEELSSIDLRDSLCRVSSPENEMNYITGGFNESKWKVEDFNELISDLSVSNFQLVADSIDSLRDLTEFISSNKIVIGYETKKENFIRPSCEEKLLKRLKVLYASLENVETILKESTKKARNKLQREWNNFENGVADEDQEGELASEDGDGANRWLIGSQGWPQLHAPALPHPALPSAGPRESDPGEVARAPSADPAEAQATAPEAAIAEQQQQQEYIAAEGQEGSSGGRAEEGQAEEQAGVEGSEAERREEAGEGAGGKEIKKEDTRGEAGGEDRRGGGRRKEKGDDEEPVQTRRVLRARGVSSYTEQLFSDEDSEEEDQLDGWADIEAIYATPSSQISAPTPNTPTKARESCDDSDKEDSDQDWILPSSRKRKSKRPSASRRLKSFQHKLHNINKVEHDAKLTSDDQQQQQQHARQSPDKHNTKVPALLHTTPRQPLSRPAVKSLPPRAIVKVPSKSQNAGPRLDPATAAAWTGDSSAVPLSAVKVEPKQDPGLHSVLDIKDEGPIYDGNASSATPSSQQQQPQPNYVVVTTGHAPVANYYVMQQNPPVTAVVQHSQFIQPTAFVSQMVSQPQVQPLQSVQTVPAEGSYYVQQTPHQNYIVQNPAGLITTAPRQAFIATTANPQVVYQHQQQPAPHLLQHQQLQQQQQQQQQQHQQQQQQVVTTTGNYIQYVAAPQGHAQQSSPAQPRIINTTTLTPPRQIAYRMRAPATTGQNNGSRMPLPARQQNFPHPNGAVIRSAPIAANVLRPGQRIGQPRAIAPRRQIAPRQPNPGNKATQPSANSAKSQPAASLIVLSDSDDEIELIIPEKSIGTPAPSSSPSKKRPNEASVNIGNIISGSGINQTTKLPAELMQRIGEGNISISPIKPAPAPVTASSTQLVVVVNETGSHYALALPNGSKLILTPEQVAQIRASNGGKLVL